MDPQRRAGAVGVAGRRACSPSCSSRAGPTRSQAQARRLQDGQSILDAVGDQAKTLQSGLGASDRDKLDEYFTSVRELEQRLAQAEEWAKKPKPKVDAKPPQNIANPADLIGQDAALVRPHPPGPADRFDPAGHAQLLGTSGVPPIPGVSLGHHDLSHHGKDPTKIAQLKNVEMER